MTAAYPIPRFRPAIWFGVLFLLLIGTERLIVASAVFLQRPLLPYAVTFDLLVIVPGVFYWIVVRRYQLPVSTLAGVLGGCLTLAYWLLPAGQQTPLRALRILPMLLEGITLALLAVKARRLVRCYQVAYQQQPSFWWATQRVLPQVLGLAGTLLVAEIEMLRYALLGWWAKPATMPKAIAFSTHRDSGFTAFAVMLGAALAVEAAVVHLLASLWSARLAGWLLFFDAYTLLMLVAHGHAVRLRPVLLTADVLVLNVGFIWHLAVPRSALLASKPLRDNPVPAAGLVNLTKLLFTPPNVLLTFAQPVTVQGLYGIRRTVHHLAVYVDQPQYFIAEIESVIPPTSRSASN